MQAKLKAGENRHNLRYFAPLPLPYTSSISSSTCGISHLPRLSRFTIEEGFGTKILGGKGR